MKRGGFDRESRDAVRSAIKQICFGVGNAKEAADEIAAEFSHLEAVQTFCDFVRASKRGVARGSAGR
jgi:acyl-[acyl carrier protein]--UDP-N-acetylglucosamine O-acyltransferase